MQGEPAEIGTGVLQKVRPLAAAAHRIEPDIPIERGSAEAMGDDGQSTESAYPVPLGQGTDEIVSRCFHALTRSFTLHAMYQSSESGFASQGSLLSMIFPFGGRGPRAAMCFRRAMCAAKSSCRRRIEG
jgi:hypothetical protein